MIKLELKPEEVNLFLKGLESLPFGQVANLYFTTKNSAEAQIKAANTKTPDSMSEVIPAKD